MSTSNTGHDDEARVAALLREMDEYDRGLLVGALAMHSCIHRSRGDGAEITSPVEEIFFTDIGALMKPRVTLGDIKLIQRIYWGQERQAQRMLRSPIPC